jgi:hypothetical protein
MALLFQGQALPLSSDGLSATAVNLGIHVAEIWSVVTVETSGCGFLPDGRPQIRYERHVFHRLTQGKFDDGDVSDPSAGGYGPAGGHQYDRLQRAIAKAPADKNVRAAALQSASWGIGQIMGENYSAAGFTAVEDMVTAMSDSEDKQLKAMASFLTANRLNIALQAHDWTSFARRYNGPNFAVNRYDLNLNAEFQKCLAGALPDLTVRAAQLYLTYLGFHPGGVDGVAGKLTLAALTEFQTKHNIKPTNAIDDQVVSALSAAVIAASNGGS